MKTKIILTGLFLVMIACFSHAQFIAGGNTHSLIICDDNTVMSWGNNSFGQLGNGSSGNSNVPVNVSNLTNVLKIAGGFNHSLALKSNGTVWTWG